MAAGIATLSVALVLTLLPIGRFRFPSVWMGVAEGVLGVLAIVIGMRTLGRETGTPSDLGNRAAEIVPAKRP